jgi:AcrR family transcriptional regulator
MQRPDEAKRLAILDAAEQHFAKRPFHEVRLDEIAAAAKVGKGTLYIYFQSKDHLYVELLQRGFVDLVDRVVEIARKTTDAWAALEAIVQHLSKWSLKNPELFELMRSGIHPSGTTSFRRRRRELGEIIGEVIQRGVKTKQMRDASPLLTGQYVPAMIRAAVVWGPRDAKPADVTRHVMTLLRGGLGRKA